ncbi:MAG: ABC transporter permease [Veillonellaceae bacterium]|nr:ABC transporter permease [Veillonellaceae bacterium]
MRRLRAMLVKEFIQMRRDPATVSLMIIIPIIQLLLFGFAVHTEVKHMPTVVFDQSRQAESRELLDTFTGTGYYDIRYVADSYKEVQWVIDSGEAQVGIIFPPDFAEQIRHGRPTAVQVIVDASDNMTAASAISTAEFIGRLQAEKAMRVQILAQTGRVWEPPYEVRVRPWYNPDLVSEFFMVPGIMGIVLTMTLVVATSMAIVREREQGTLEQLLVTPLATTELMLGKIIPYVFIGYIQITLILILGKLVFDVSFAGSVVLFYLLATLFVVGLLSLGILISTIAKSQMQAMQMSTFIFMPSMLLSGFVFPIAAMPDAFRYLSQVIPMTHFLQVVRGIMLKGIGFADLWWPTLALLVFTVVSLSLAVSRFRRSLQ